MVVQWGRLSKLDIERLWLGLWGVRSEGGGITVMDRVRM